MASIDSASRRGTALQGVCIVNDHVAALVELVEELVKAGDYIHDEKDCHQDCPWVSARGNAVAYLKEECQTKHAPTIGAVQ
jgi:hypothetical protein